jgi:DNA-binding NarL/FixJ family response regulator
MTIRIVLADDHKIVRDGLRSLLEKEKDMEVVAEADNGRTTVELVKDMRPDVVVMDIGMRDLNGVEATRQVSSGWPGVKVIALSMHSDRRFVEGMLEAGAAGYLLKDSAFEELARAIRAVVAGQTYLAPDVAGVVVETLVSKSPRTPPSRSAALTPREREVLQLLSEGKATKHIASLLKVSVKTVETHRSRIMDKLGVYSVAGLTKYAIREGLTDAEH